MTEKVSPEMEAGHVLESVPRGPTPVELEGEGRAAKPGTGAMTLRQRHRREVCDLGSGKGFVDIMSKAKS